MIRRSTAASVLFALLLAACRDASGALGTSPAEARTHANDMFRGLGVRFVNVQRAPKFATGRLKLERYALSPSKIIDDTSVWTSRPAAQTSLLELEGSQTATGYLFAPRAGAPTPARAGAARHEMRLTQLRDGEYQWNTVVDHAIGQISPADGAAGMSAWLASFQRPERDIRNDLRTVLPRTSAALGRLFVLDSVHTVGLVDGSTIVDLRFRADAKSIRPTMPALADYVDKYVQRGRGSIELTDGRARFLAFDVDDGIFRFHFRTRDGRLLAFDGPARPMPDSLAMRVSAYERFLIFDVGVSDLVADFTMVRMARERGWNMRFHRKPEWHLPLAVRHLISGALDRPFAQSGMLFRVTLRDDGGQTILARRFDVAVKESAIVRWLGGLGSRAMEDFVGKAEAEENRFLADALLALRADLVAALGG